MFKYLVVLALALVAVMAAPPAPEAGVPRGPAPVPRDLQTANQLYYGSYGYPAYSGYAYSAGVVPSYYGGVYYG